MSKSPSAASRTSASPSYSISRAVASAVFALILAFGLCSFAQPLQPTQAFAADDGLVAGFIEGYVVQDGVLVQVQEAVLSAAQDPSLSAQDETTLAAAVAAKDAFATDYTTQSQDPYPEPENHVSSETLLNAYNTYKAAVDAGDNVTALTEYYAGITALDLSNDYDAFSGGTESLSLFTGLTSLNLSNTGITNITALGSMTDLTSLDLSSNSVTDVSPLQTLVNLQELSLARCRGISSYSPLAELSALQVLDMSDTDMTNAKLEMLQQSIYSLTHLTTLSLANNANIDRLTNITANTLITTLDVSNTGLTSLNDVNGFSQIITTLYANGLSLSDSDPLAGLVSITQREGFASVAGTVSWDLGDSYVLSADTNGRIAALTTALASGRFVAPEAGEGIVAQVEGIGVFTSLAAALESEGSHIKLIADTNEAGIAIGSSSGEVFGESPVKTIDLNGHTFTATSGSGAITVYADATLTISDNSSSGSGKVAFASTNEGSTLVNYGAVELYGGTIERTSTNEDLTESYAILNQGTMEISGATVTSGLTYPSVILNGWDGNGEAGNSATLTIDWADVSGARRCIKNVDYAHLNINDGTFLNESSGLGDAGNLLNKSSASITGGTFTVTNANAHNIIVAADSNTETPTVTTSLQGGLFVAPANTHNIAPAEGVSVAAMGTVSLIDSESDVLAFSYQETAEDFPGGKLSFPLAKLLLPSGATEGELVGMYTLQTALEAYDVIVDLTYNGAAHELTAGSFALKPKGGTGEESALVAGSDYTLVSIKKSSRADNGNADTFDGTASATNYPTRAGWYTVKFAGAGSFAGTEIEADFQVKPADLDDVTASLSQTTYNYDGTAHLPTVNTPVTLGAVTVIGPGSDDAEYSIENPSADDQKKGGSHYVVLRSTGKNFAADSTKQLEYTVTPITLTIDNVVSWSPDISEPLAYTGTDWEPVPTIQVTLPGASEPTTLQLGTDYTITYADNNAAGAVDAATATITGVNNYAGSFVQHFTISKTKASIAGSPTSLNMRTNSPASSIAVQVEHVNTATLSVVSSDTSVASATLTAVEGEPGKYTLVVSQLGVAGSATITVSGDAESDNYAEPDNLVITVNVAAEGRTLTVTASHLDVTVPITAENVRVQHGTDEPLPALDGEGLSYALADDTAYTVTLSGLGASGPLGYQVSTTDSATTSTQTLIAADEENPSYNFVLFPVAYPITYADVDGAVFPGGGSDPNPATYTIEDTVTLVNPVTRNGNAFSGWRGTDLTGLAQTVTIPEGSKGARTFTAEYARNLGDGVISAIADQEYAGGREVRPEFTVKWPTSGEQVTLEEDVDYTVSWSNNTQPGLSTDTNAPTVTLTGMGQYAGTLSQTFSIKTALTADMVDAIAAQPYAYGTQITPTVTVRNGQTILSQLTDYDVAYGANNTVSGGGSVVITPKGAYMGDPVTKTFEITPISISGCTVTLSEVSYTYDGDPAEPTVTSIRVNDAEHTDITYTTQYDTDHTAAGTHYVTVTGTGNFTGTTRGEYTIGKRGARLWMANTPGSSTFVLNASINMRDHLDGRQFYVVYGGDGEVTVTADDPSIIDVAYTPGEGGGTIVVTPKKVGFSDLIISSSEGTNYRAAMVEPRIYVDPVHVAMPTYTAPATPVVYSGSEQNGLALGSGTIDTSSAAYTVAGDVSGTNAGEYTFTVTPNEGYQWSGAEEGHRSDPISFTWAIDQASMSDVAIAAIPDQTYTGQALRPVPTVTFNGQQVASTAYSVAWSNNTNVSDTPVVTVTAVANGNFTGSKTTTFAIVPSDDWDVTPFLSANGEEVESQQFTGEGTQDSPFVATRVYDGTSYELGLKAALTGATVTVKSGTAEQQDAGNATVTFTVTDPAGNYNSKDVVAKLVIQALKTISTEAPSGTVTMTGDDDFGAESAGGKVLDLVVVEKTATTASAEDAARALELKERYLTEGLDESAFKVFDVTLMKHDVGTDPASGEERHDGFGETSVSLPVGAKYAGRTAHVVELHQGLDDSGESTVEEIPFPDQAVSATGYVTVPVTKLSEFVVTVDELVEYTVSFYSDHGTSTASQTVVAGETATRPLDPSADGYTFGGWYTESALTNAYDFSTPVTSDLQLYAKWTAVPTPDPDSDPDPNPDATTYTVTFYTAHGTPPAAQTVASGDKAVKPADPAADGYTFAGWYTDEAFTNAYDFDAAVTADVDLYAKWTSGSSSGGTDNATAGGSDSGTSSQLKDPITRPATKSASSTPKTGDMIAIGVPIVIALIAAGALIFALARLRRRDDDSTTTSKND